ncbi:VOC family protein [Tomitella biformata]|uniref:VOC family protein n=1 Tax=Tomitella biformata TaxID=630403 RepID=UPI0004645C1D|nr:VOC family protein [Tomitella biformata]
MTVLRVVPVLTVRDLAAAIALHANTLGLTVVMNHGWIATLARPDQSMQLSLITEDLTAPCNPALSVEVDDVDAHHALALASGVEIVHPLTDEDWGVRRYFYRDAAGNVVNVLAHR